MPPMGKLFLRPFFHVILISYVLEFDNIVTPGNNLVRSWSDYLDNPVGSNAIAPVEMSVFVKCDGSTLDHLVRPRSYILDKPIGSIVLNLTLQKCPSSSNQKSREKRVEIHSHKHTQTHTEITM